MGTLTARGNLMKSDSSEPADVAVYNDNMDRVHNEVMSVPYVTSDPNATDSFPGKIIMEDAGDPTFFLPEFKRYRTDLGGFWQTATRGTWIAYTPDLAFAELGNGTLLGRYSYMGNLMWCEILLIRGSTTVFEPSGLGFPTPGGFHVREPDNASQGYIGEWMARVGGGSPNLRKGRVNRRITGVGVDLQPRTPTTTGSQSITDAAPLAWATGDRIHLRTMCEVDR